MYLKWVSSEHLWLDVIDWRVFLYNISLSVSECWCILMSDLCCEVLYMGLFSYDSFLLIVAKFITLAFFSVKTRHDTLVFTLQIKVAICVPNHLWIWFKKSNIMTNLYLLLTGSPEVDVNNRFKWGSYAKFTLHLAGRVYYRSKVKCYCLM